MKSSWSENYRNTSFNRWLREEAVSSSSMLRKNMARLRVQLQVLESVISLEEITSERLGRISTAVNHLTTELHLLVTLTENQ